MPSDRRPPLSRDALEVRPQFVDGGFGPHQAVGSKWYEVGHRGVAARHRQFGGDEPRFEAGRRQCVPEPRLGVIPAFPRCAGAVSAAARGENDEFGVAEQSGIGLRVDRYSWSDQVVDPGLDRAGRALVVEGKAQHDGVGLLDLIDQLDAERE